MFEFQGAVSTLGEHLLSPDCLSTTQSAAELFYSKQITFALAPFIVTVISFLFWYLKSCRRRVSFFAKRTRSNVTTPKDKFILTICTIIYLLFPTLCTQSFEIFHCRSVAGQQYLAADMEEPCYEGRHLTMVLLLGVSQLLAFVLGLPILVLLFLRRNKYLDSDDQENGGLKKHATIVRYGLFYEAYKEDTYYWEIVITWRKIMIVALSVFGGEMGIERQVQSVLAVLLVCISLEIAGDPFQLITNRFRILGRLEKATLFVQWATMWCGSMIYASQDRASKGFVMFLSFVVAVLNIGMLLWLGVRLLLECNQERQEQKRKAPGQTKSPSMLSQRIGSLARIFGIKTNGEITAEDGDVQTLNVPDRNPMYRPELSKKGKTKSTKSGKEKNNVEVTEIELIVTDSGGNGKPKKQRRLSSRELMESVKTAANSNGTSNKSKRRSFIKVTNDEIGEDDYFQDIETGEFVWEIPADGDLVTGAALSANSNSNGSNKSKRRSFIKVTNDEIGEDDYFQDIETDEFVWEIPADGDLVTGAALSANSNESNKSKRRSFIKVTNNEIGEDDYFQDVETDETVWEIPADGDLVAM